MYPEVSDDVTGPMLGKATSAVQGYLLVKACAAHGSTARAQSCESCTTCRALQNITHDEV